METKQKRKQYDKPDTGIQNTQDTNGTTIDSNWAITDGMGIHKLQYVSESHMLARTDKYSSYLTN